MQQFVFGEARACIREHRFIVLAGSKVTVWDQTITGWSYATLQKALAKRGKLRWLTNEYGVFTSDVAFSSASAAASIVSGEPVSGPASWVEISSGAALREILAQQDICIVDPVFVLRMPKIGVDATARLNHDRVGLTVLKHSIVRAKWVGLDVGYAKLNRQYLSDGTIARIEGNLGLMMRDIEFSSASGAASIVKGNNSNGRSDWRIEAAGETYYEWCLDHKAQQ